MRLIISALLLACLVPAAHGEMFGKDYPPCGDQPNTVAIVDCIDAKTKAWDQRLNAAYQALGQAVDQAQREPLRRAQRLWVQYRDANCAFYGAHDGTIRMVLGAECMRSMSQDRALELEQAARP